MVMTIFIFKPQEMDKIAYNQADGFIGEFYGIHKVKLLMTRAI